MRVLVVGGSGYLGQFVLKAFSDAYPDTEWVGYTYKSTKLPIPPEDDVHAYEVDLATGEGADACIADATKGGESLDLIVNCAAASSPGWCEKNETAATALNVPSKLLDAMTAASETIGEPLLIHMSTDQVYGGDERRSTEDQCPANPVNAYARSKLKGEEEVAKRWAKHVIFRPSIITGPQPPYAPVNRPLFLDFIVDALKGTKPVGFFVDEWRSPVCAHDIVGHVKIFADRVRARGVSTRRI
jgi:dTDP-4-dehydrorhamnose reductase|tara:strand:- start:291 stop:1019 length:729 start_codon:yes stop_codon:yes gene_type:complete